MERLRRRLSVARLGSPVTQCTQLLGTKTDVTRFVAGQTVGALTVLTPPSLGDRSISSSTCHLEPALGVELDELQDGTVPLGRELPRHYVAVVFHQVRSIVSPFLTAPQPSESHEVDRFRRAASEDYPLGRRV